MKNYILDLNLIDLVSEKHKALREEVNRRNSHPLNQTETHILAKLELHSMLSISEISRLINISRQGAQKCINGLLAEDYVESVQVEGNTRDKNITLTGKGAEACRSMLQIKLDMEQQIANRLGPEQVELLKTLLTEDWL
ncbi:MarR family winged helix-turn-helix transcriptional regulator [Paenibacillus sp. HW567]|uniref:MarR family winged helix-turn-helix transcriptional regulator n=1 Tax=Paenibacillus sp. HW567 TaxID=1034769 RepID=UPI00036E6B58|nr:MarR family transcriptional regulator [Paenibacillus sp. HW567]